MKKIFLLAAFLIASTTILSADMLSDLLKYKNDRIAAYQYGHGIGCSQTLVDVIIDVYKDWYKIGRQAARKDLEKLPVYRDYEEYRKGSKHAIETAQRSGEITYGRFKNMIEETPKRGFYHGYYSIYNPTLQIFN